jgi:hypothetical protein
MLEQHGTVKSVTLIPNHEGGSFGVLDLSKWNEGEAKAVREVLGREGYVY